ncbi:MIP/aquaporin family protein [Massilia terrae]|uniref:Aquaporin family protein n=1 Tax=Massilia terrae TaxID=1811224 RepID=A0ABT2D008_9BURK|nr:MIP/aquaporin family protein [Massilia terrae]MCS0659563.1 aquaporin family protein [Massilia terrae]
MTLARRLVAEGVGTAMLLAVVVGSATMADRLAGGNQALSLLANTIATGAGLLALILMFGTISGAHFNSIVTLSEAWQGNVPRREVLPYLAAQLLGAFAGVAAAHLMFGLAPFETSTHMRAGPAMWWSEFVATFGLIGVIMGCSRSRPSLTPFAVASYITAGYWFTASSSFANPAVTLARMATSTVAGIRPADATGFIIAELLGAAAATVLFGWLYPPAPAGATVAGTVTPGEFAGSSDQGVRPPRI